MDNSGLCWIISTLYRAIAAPVERDGVYQTHRTYAPVAETQTMSHIVDSVQLDGGLSRLNSADDDVVQWLANIGKWTCIWKKNKNKKNENLKLETDTLYNCPPYDLHSPANCGRIRQAPADLGSASCCCISQWINTLKATSESTRLHSKCEYKFLRVFLKHS